MAAATLRVHQNRFWVRAAEPESITRLDKISCPTLLITAVQDNPIIRRNAVLLQQHIPKVTWLTVDGVAHMPNMERAKQINGMIAAFLKK